MADLKGITPPACYEPKTGEFLIDPHAPEKIKTQAITFALSPQGNSADLPDLRQALSAAGNCPATGKVSGDLPIRIKATGLHI